MPTQYAAINTKKFLDAEGLKYFSRKLNNYPTNEILETVIDGIQDALDEKLDADLKGANNGVAELDSTGIVPLSQLPSYDDDFAAKADKDTDAVEGNFAAFDSEGNPVDSGYKDADYMKEMVILSYGSSTWNDFISAYNKNRVVYCRASSNSNPASGAKTRMAFMAYVNKEDAPTEVEFQYYRSVSSHTNDVQGDQVFVYKLTSNGSWSVTTRNAFTKVVAGDNLTSSFTTGTNSVITISSNYSTATQSADGLMSSTDKTKLDTNVVALNQGTSNAGKFLIVNSSGNVEAIAMSVWQGGDY